MDEPNVQKQILAGSDSNSEESARNESVPLPLDKRICLVGSVKEDPVTCRAAQAFGIPILTSDTGLEYVNDVSCTTIFILDDFEGSNVKELHKNPHRILGSIGLQQLADKKEKLPNNTRPLYNMAMIGVVVCFTGFRKKEDLTKLIPLIHHMGGSIRKDMVAKVTHLIANCCGGDKYQYATTFKVPVMSQDWVTACWDQRKDLTLCSTIDSLTTSHKLKPFYGARVCFYGFSNDETKHMHEVLEANGGMITKIEDPLCTHVVVDESSVTERPDGQPKALLVKAEWFWASVQNVACADEKDYLFDDYLECLVSPGRRDSHAATPSGSSRRKRKRLHETLSSLVRNDSPAIHKRRSSVSDAGLLSVSGSFLDCTTSPDKGLLDQAEGASVETPRKNLSPRQQVFLELIQTESNYVNILHTIMTMFKSHLDDMPESEALLNNTELKIIFGNLPPIYETHSKMLEELRWGSSHWSEDTSVGNILLKYSHDLLKAYPPFVNFFEAMKEMLIQCDLNKPRFHAFLKVCQTRPECGRQSLQDLLIRPVQRLPSISLLLNDILKHTSKSNQDHSALEKALSAIKEVMTHINEDKRKTEGQRVMFDIFNEIDNCPPDLVSSHRSFITRCEVTELSDGLSGRGNPLVLFLFTDQLEVCKKRSKAFNTLKSPNTMNGFHSKASSKPYKHICMLALNTIKRVIDIRETEDCQKVFALVTRDHQELKEKLFSFTMTEDDVDKSTFLKTLCRHIANTAYSADAEKFLAYLEPHQLDIDTSDVTMGTLSKAFKFATRTRIKVGRAFSFNKTPSKLKRAMSTMMSPFGSSTNITPASQLANMRLASYNNINELGNTTDSGNETPSGETLIAPMSVQPTRKLKCSSLSVTALKRL